MLVADGIKIRAAMNSRGESRNEGVEEWVRMEVKNDMPGTDSIKVCAVASNREGSRVKKRRADCR